MGEQDGKKACFFPANAWLRMARQGDAPWMVSWHLIFRVITNIISNLIKSFQDELLSFLLMKKINNALKEKTLIHYEIKEKLDSKPATFEIVEEKREVLGCA